MLEAWAAGRTLWPAVPRLQPPREPDQAPHLGVPVTKCLDTGAFHWLHFAQGW